MERKQYDEMQSTMKELREFARASVGLADKVQSILSNTTQWENIRENAQILAKQEKESLESIKAETMIAMNRLPAELAPLRNKIAEQERQANSLMSQAHVAKGEADAALAKANALLSEAEKMSGKEPAKKTEEVIPVPARRGRPPKES